MRNLKRSVNMGFRVTAEEHELILGRMNDVGISSVRAYMLKMALNGYIFNIDLADVRECSRLLRIVSNNVNQMAKRANEGGNIYAADLADIQVRLDEIWAQQNKLNASLAKLLEVA